MSRTDTVAIEVTDLSKTFAAGRRGKQHLAFDGVTFRTFAAHTLAIVGESGAGKTTLMHCVAGLESPTAGSVRVGGHELRRSRRRPSAVQMVFQNPADALDPMRSVGASIAEPLRSLPRAGRRKRVDEVMQLVGLDPSRARERPKTFSGGQQQRVVIARALAPEPAVLLCDEPTSALDVSVQAQIVNLLLELQRRLGFAMILVTHDLALARVLADDVLVLKDGTVRHQGPTSGLLNDARQLDEYVRGLVTAARRAQLRRDGPTSVSALSPVPAAVSGSAISTCLTERSPEV